ncbi:E3 ubiquitin ligase PQT3-like isoform X4 [Carex rostrata]
MATIYYRFKSQKEFKLLYIESAYISVNNLRRRLCESIKLRRGDGLLLFNSQTNAEYVNGDALIPKNTSVLLQRVPPAWHVIIQLKEENASREATTSSSTSTVEEPGDLTWDDFGEDPFSSVMIDASNNQLIKSKSEETAGIGHDKLVVSNFKENHGTKRKVPPIGYICHRCNTPGHFIQHCHTNMDRNYDNKRLRRHNGVTSAIVQPDHFTFVKEMEKVPTMIPKQSRTDIPLGLRCPLCSEIMEAASIALKCCMKSFCSKCIRDHITNTGMCACGSRNVAADDLIPNKTIQKLVEELSSHTTGSSGTTQQSGS